ncbi:flagellar hook-length control protein FliK [Burkholderia cenocepacia]|uniref:flagellar hook-length control protein FliK n=4 Tax=Burkholderia cenocepacia TaxID=95486 RepID=UPI00285521F7|nr:flagellar hook-length control protein FliK [Burkholderia cenocepacia]MDR8048816.1 flagellar hook-length control protein FliK [Burkholderia cenocepacia]MDV3098951.1 flagellar hook-length control protein FliK [Burkholderia cenocepacia]HDR9877944.1 flagellar hook-length control protein FliK [Burkholderia cenocepacia]HDR9885600.1 flagellar hook-length control protein FliK [Burkholderia cenocepacia]
MTGIDSVAAALLASRLDSLLTGTVSAPAGGGATAQVGTPGAGASSAPPAGSPPAAPPASTQTALSEVGRVLDAISRSGGDATPAIVGRLPLLADPAVLLTDTPVPARAPAVSGPAAPATPASAQASSVAAARDALAPPPVAALRAALAQAVSESGLFYESHLAQWLAGQRPLAALMREPQARLATALAPVDPEAVPHASPDVLDELLAQRPPLPAAARASAQPPAQGGAPAREPAQPALAAARQGASLPSDPADPLAAHADARWTPARAELAAASSDPQPPLATVHPAAVPLVRQQLDALATDQFRWTGEAWPGARLDWTIEPDEPGHRAPRGGGDDDAGDGIAWRTRLTLTLPSLGTVDAELVLNGAQLVARLRANQTGADRLTRNEAALRQRLEGSGLKVGGLSIRAVDDGPDGFDLFAAQAAAAAYARGAAGGADVRVPGDDDEALP